MRDLVIVGTGGVGRAVRQFVDDINGSDARWRILGFLDDALPSADPQGNGLPILGPLDWLAGNPEVAVLVGIGRPAARRDAVARLSALGAGEFPPLVHPAAYVPAGVPVGRGAIIYPGARIEVDGTVGDFAIINMNATIGHDTRIGDYVTIGPGCAVGGNVDLGTGAFLGIGACTVQRIQVGAWSVIGAGAAVIGDVADGTTVVGVPARPTPRGKGAP